MKIIFNGLYLTGKHIGSGFWRFSLNLMSELATRPGVEVAAFGPGERPKELKSSISWISQNENDWNLDRAMNHLSENEITADYLLFPHLELPKHLPQNFKSIAVVHDLIPTLFLTSRYLLTGKTPFKMIGTQGFAEKWRLKTNLPKLHRVVAGSQSTRADILRLIKPQEPEKIFSIPYGVDSIFAANRFTDRTQLLKSLSLTEKKYLIYFGGHTYRKNVDRLLKAYLSITTEHRKEFPLVILGSGLSQSWRERLKSQPSVLLPGKLSSEDLAKLVAGAKFSIYPTLYEGFGFPLIESLAAGVWPLASNIPTSREILGETFPFFDPYSVKAIQGEIEAAIKAPLDLLEKRIASQNLETYTWKNAVDLFLKNIK
jgi:glycosyltransferase involved in cell wall biosynthesis